MDNIKKNDPIVSIITMVLNGEKYLENCIESVLSQNYENIEHIFVDGKSTDKTTEILQKYSSKYPDRVRFISEPDRGTGDAWNKGIRMSKGEIFGWIGADDLYEPNAIKTAVDFFKENESADFVYGGVNYIDKNGSFLHCIKAEPFNFNKLLNHSCTVPTPSSFYRRKVLETVGDFDLLGNDFDFFLKVAKKFSISHVEKVLSNYRQHSGSQNTGTNWKLRLMWKKEDYLVSRRHGGRLFSGYSFRYYRIAFLYYPLIFIEYLKKLASPSKSSTGKSRNFLSSFIIKLLLPAKRWLAIHTDSTGKKYRNQNMGKRKEYWANIQINDVTDNYVENILQNVKFESFLEIGCCGGNKLYNISKNNPNAAIVGTDINPMSVEIGNKSLKEAGINNVELKLKRAEALDEFPDNSFDIVFSFSTLMFIRPQYISKVLENMVKISKKHIILFETQGKDHQRDPQGTGQFCWPKNWKRDYVSLFNKLGVDESKITCESIPEQVWAPSGGDATYIRVEI